MARKLQRRPTPAAGMTLLEIMVVVLIMGMLATIVAKKVVDRYQQAKMETARTEIGVVREAVELFYLDNDFYPSSVEDLVKKPTTGREVKKWPENGYLDRVPVDPWRNEYIYIAPATDGPFEIISLGRDGAEGGEGYDRDIRSSDLRGTGQDH